MSRLMLSTGAICTARTILNWQNVNEDSTCKSSPRVFYHNDLIKLRAQRGQLVSKIVSSSSLNQSSVTPVTSSAGRFALVL